MNTTTTEIREESPASISPEARRLLIHLQQNAYGKIRAIKAAVLADRLGSSVGEIQEWVEELRRKQIFVAASRDGKIGGIYLPATDAERDEFIEKFEHVTMTQVQTLSVLKKARRVQRLDVGQQRLF